MSSVAPDPFPTTVEAVTSATRKAFGAIDAVPVSGRMHTLQHKLYNVLVGWCQAIYADGTSGRSIEGDAPNEFKLQLSAVMDLCGFGPDKSRNYDHFEHVAESLMGFRVVYGGFELLSQGVLVPNDPTMQRSRRRRRADQLTDEDHVQLVSRIHFRWSDDELLVEFPKALARQMLAPEHFALLQWEQMLQFSSRAAFVVYEQSVRYADEGQTPRRHWRDYSRVLTGEPEPHKSFREFNKLLRRAVESVSQVTGRPLKVRQWKTGRFIEDVAILIGAPAQPSLELHAVDSELLNKLMSCGVEQKIAVKLLESTPAAVVAANIDYAVTKRRSGAKIDRLPAYIVAAIRSDFAAARAAQGRALAAAPAPVPAADVRAAAPPPNPIESFIETVKALPAYVRAMMLKQELAGSSEHRPRLLPKSVLSGSATAEDLDDPRVIAYLAQCLQRTRQKDAEAAAPGPTQ